MRRFVIACAAAGLLGHAAWAGVVVEMEVKAGDAPGKAGGETLSVQGEMIRMDSLTAGDWEQSVIFRDQAMYFVDHGKKVCRKIDQQGIDQLGGQLNEMRQTMESLPPEQRAMMEKMMQGKMPGMKAPAARRVEAGGKDQVGAYPCTLYSVFEDGKRVQEVCMADGSPGEEMAEAMEAMRALSKFAAGLTKAAESLPFGKMVELPHQYPDEMQGFPVRTRAFNRKGEIKTERTLKSVTRRDLEAGIFAIPKGYEVRSLEQEMQQGR